MKNEIKRTQKKSDVGPGARI